MQLKDLSANKKNPRKISDKKLEALKKSLTKFGDLSGFVFNRRTGTLISGHQRQKAFQDGKIQIDRDYTIPTKALTVAEGYVLIGDERFKYREVDADDTWANEAMLAANKHGGEWDNSILQDILKDIPELHIELTGFELSDIELTQEELDAQSEKDDVVSEVPKVAKSRLCDLWILGSHRLLCGDSTDKAQVERLMAGEKADMVFTDPPYGDANLLDANGKYIYRNDNNGRKNQVYSGYQGQGSFTFPNIHEVISSIADKQIVWGGNALPLPISRSWIVWDKTVSDEGGNWFSDCELAWCNLDIPIFKVKHVFQGAHKEGEKEERVHPTQKPVEMLVKLLKRVEEKKGNRKYKTDFIVDLFLGSGSTLIACEKTNRKCYGMEIDPLYVDVILARWAKYTGKDPIREDGKKWSELPCN